MLKLDDNDCDDDDDNSNNSVHFNVSFVNVPVYQNWANYKIKVDI
jgi:hypothetical protein